MGIIATLSSWSRPQILQIIKLTNHQSDTLTPKRRDVISFLFWKAGFLQRRRIYRVISLRNPDGIIVDSSNQKYFPYAAPKVSRLKLISLVLSCIFDVLSEDSNLFVSRVVMVLVRLNTRQAC